MFGSNKTKNHPSHFYLMAMCVHFTATALLCIGIFTPYWASVREQVGNTDANTIFDKGLIVSCADSSYTGCSQTNSFSDFSGVFQASYIIGIITVIVAFLVLQFFVLGICIKGCKEMNLSIPFAVASILLGCSLIVVLILFEISLTYDVTTGNRFRESTFGMSRGIIVIAVILYFIASLLLIGEFFKRHKASPYKPSSDPKPRNRPLPQPSYRTHAPAAVTQTDEDIHSIVIKDPGTFAAAAPRGAPAQATELPPRYTPHEKGGPSLRACGRLDCRMCNYVVESSVFWGPAGVFSIREHLDCQENNVVYAISCLKDDVVFIGHSKEWLEKTFAHHVNNIRSRYRKDPVADHFNLPGHTMDDIRIQALATIDCDYDTRSRLETALSYQMNNPHNSYYGVNNNFVFL